LGGKSLLLLSQWRGNESIVLTGGVGEREMIEERTFLLYSKVEEKKGGETKRRGQPPSLNHLKGERFK